MVDKSMPPLQEKDRDDNRTAGANIQLRLERIACPLCGSQDSSIVQTSRDNLCGIPGEFAIARCTQCAHRFMNPRPVLECLGDCYPEQYGPHQSAPNPAGPLTSKQEHAMGGSGDTNSTGRPLYLRILPLRHIPGLKRFYNWLMDDRSQPVPSVQMLGHQTDLPRLESETSSAPPRALELGCATGLYLMRLQEAGYVATGIEPGERPAMIAKAAGLDVHCGTLEACDLPTHTFDLAAAWMVIEHVPDPRGTLEHLNVLIKPGGMLLFSIPNAGCWEPRAFGKYWYVWELPRHLHHFTPNSIRTLLEQCCFSDIRIIHQRNLSNVIGSLALSILARWPESRFGRWLLHYPDRPTQPLKLCLAPLAHVLAWLGQGGRLTISARRPASLESVRSDSSGTRL